MEAIKPEDLNNHIGAVRSTSWFTVTPRNDKPIC